MSGFRTFYKNPMTLLLAFCTAYLMACIIFFSFYLNEIADQFKGGFLSQNYQELSRSDVFTLTTRLEALTSSIDWICLFGARNGQTFFEKKNGDCASGFFQRLVKITNDPVGDLDLRIVLRAPNAAIYLFLTQAAITVVLMLWLGFMIVGWQKQKYATERLLAERVRTMAHDLRSPLTAMTLVMQKSLNREDEAWQLLSSASAKLTAMAEQFLQISRDTLSEGHFSAPAVHGEAPTARAATETTATFTLAQLSTELEHLIHEKRVEFAQIPQLKIHLYKAPETKSIRLRGDLLDCIRILSNLINNSVESLTLERKAISIDLSEEAGFARLEVRDSGAGIPKEILAKLGRENFTHGKAQGNGIALKHAFDTLAAWGGTIAIDSSPGNGTKVTVCLKSV